MTPSYGKNGNVVMNGSFHQAISPICGTDNENGEWEVVYRKIGFKTFG
jgi:hypothetical protein